MTGNAAATFEADTGKRQFVTFQVQSKRYGVPIESVAEMTQIQASYPISGAPGWILGMMQLRSSVVPILDLRLRLGLTRLEDEIEALTCDLLRQREEHVERVRSGASGQPPRDSIDCENASCDCALRSWIDRCETTEGSLTGPLLRLRTPDERLHAVLDSARALSQRGDAAGARRLLEHAEAFELKDLLQGFDGVLRDVRSRGRQMVVILRGPQENLAIAVDHIDCVASVDVGEIVPRPLHALETNAPESDLLVSCVVRKHERTELIQILDVDRVFRSTGVGSGAPLA